MREFQVQAEGERLCDSLLARHTDGHSVQLCRVYEAQYCGYNYHNFALGLDTLKLLYTLLHCVKFLLNLTVIEIVNLKFLYK